MRCKSCNTTLHYHTSGMTCRNCGLSVAHESLLEEKCVACDNFLEESEKTTGICVFCQYNLLEDSK